MARVPAYIPIVPGYNPRPIAAVAVPIAPIIPKATDELPFTIMCFTWNASGLKLCETMSQIRANETRSKFLSRKLPCIAPDFLEDIRGVINSRRPSIIVMTTQDEDSSGTYFHAELLPNTLIELDYVLLKRDTMPGVGEAASGVTLPQIPTGQPRGSAIRISIYARGDIINVLRMEESTISQFLGKESQASCNQGERSSGAIASYVWHPVYGKFAFIAVHIPSGLESLRVGQGLDYASYRTATKAANILCLLKIYNQLVASLPVESRPDHVFLLGDMNYDLVMHGKTPTAIINDISSNTTIARLKELQRYDEIKWAMGDYPLTGFKEGVAGEGPLFLPTWSLTRGRPDSCSQPAAARVDPTCFIESELSTIGWHDRILYKELMTSDYIAHCLDYNRFDVENIRASTHAGVTSFFQMQPLR